LISKATVALLLTGTTRTAEATTATESATTVLLVFLILLELLRGHVTEGSGESVTVTKCPDPGVTGNQFLHQLGGVFIYLIYRHFQFSNSLLEFLLRVFTRIEEKPFLHKPEVWC
jgi:hypothetical protein